MTIERTCEVVVLDGEDGEVTCGSVAIERVHEWWLCSDCLSDVAGARLDEVLAAE